MGSRSRRQVLCSPQALQPQPGPVRHHCGCQSKRLPSKRLPARSLHAERLQWARRWVQLRHSGAPWFARQRHTSPHTFCRHQATSPRPGLCIRAVQRRRRRCSGLIRPLQVRPQHDQVALHLVLHFLRPSGAWLGSHISAVPVLFRLPLRV